MKKCLALFSAVSIIAAMPVGAADNSLSAPSGSTSIQVTDLARNTGTLTVKSIVNYSIYPVFNATINSGDQTYTWSAVEEFKDILMLNDETVNNDITAEIISGYDSSQVKQLAASLQEDNTKPSPVTLGEGGSIGLGYYLIVDNGEEGLTKSQPILVAIPQVQNNAWVYDITVSPKSSSTDFTKKIAEDNTLVDTNTKNVGDYVDYRLWADIPTYEDAVYTDSNSALVFKITDNMSQQLTWGENSEIKVYTIRKSSATESNIASIVTNGIEVTAEGNYSLSLPTSNAKGESFTVDFTKAFLSEHKGEVVVVTFSAVLNEDAIIGNVTPENGSNTISGYDASDKKVNEANYNGTGNPNAAKLEYSNSYYGGSDVDTIKDIVTTFTFELDIEKVDKADHNTKLEGAEFEVYTDSDCKNIYTNTKFENGKLITAETTGSATGVGFDAGTYYLKEIKAPNGYKLYDGVIKVVIEANISNNQYDGTFSYMVSMIPTGGTEGTSTSDLNIVTVEDEKGLTLPGTGGIGTTIFTFGGLALVILAAIMFIVYTRKQKKQA